MLTAVPRSVDLDSFLWCGDGAQPADFYSVFDSLLQIFLSTAIIGQILTRALSNSYVIGQRTVFPVKLFRPC